jgi:hypothetical protein
MKVKNFLFAGIDLILGKDNKIYFIEANSSPGAFKSYIKIYNHCAPVRELCEFLNKKRLKKLAVISKMRWDKSVVSGRFRKLFKGKIYICDYERNKTNLSVGDGHLIDNKGKRIMPDAVLRVAAGLTKAQEKAGITVINPSSILYITLDKIKAKKAVEKYTQVKVPKYFLVKKRKDVKRILENNKKLFSNGFVLKPRRGQRSRDVFIYKSYKRIPSDFRIQRPMILEELIDPLPLFKKEFFEIRSIAVNGKYVGSMVFVSPKRPMKLVKEGRAVKTPKRFEKRIKEVTEQIVHAIDKVSR